jgi:hypothetical protein
MTKFAVINRKWTIETTDRVYMRGICSVFCVRGEWRFDLVDGLSVSGNCWKSFVRVDRDVVTILSSSMRVNSDSFSETASCTFRRTQHRLKQQQSPINARNAEAMPSVTAALGVTSGPNVFSSVFVTYVLSRKWHSPINIRSSCSAYIRMTPFP